MKPFLALPFLVALLAACDDSSGVIGGSFSDRIDSGVVAGSQEPGVDTTPVDTHSTFLTLGPADLDGPRDMPTAGTARRVYFYLAADQSLHVVGSSDGAPAGGSGPTLGRLTIWDIRLVTEDSLHATWVAAAEPGQRDTLANAKDSAGGGVVYDVVRLRYHTVAGAPEVRIAASRGALIYVRVLAWSGVDTKLYGWTPPQLPSDSVSTLVWAGNPATQVGIWGFYIRMP